MCEEINNSFELLLFSKNPALIQSCVAAGVGGVIVDWEYRGKNDRQRNYDTQINHDTLEDLLSVHNSTSAAVICRINAFGDTTAQEIEDLVRGGADELLLPMVRKEEEVIQVLRLSKDRCKVGILVETTEAVEKAAALAKLPLSRVYVGLNDLAIDRAQKQQINRLECRGMPVNIFTAIADGTVERVRNCFRSIPFGFGGLTLPEAGAPIPCRLLIAEMARLDCQFSFLRRSFLRDIQNRDPAVEIPRLKKALFDAFTEQRLRPLSSGVSQDLLKAIACISLNKDDT